MRSLTVVTFFAFVLPATAGDIVVQGQTRMSQLSVADGYKLERFARLQSQGAGLRFAETVDGDIPTLRLLGPGGCEVRLEDRNADGVFETERTTVEGKPTGRCLPTEAPYARTQLEAGIEIDGLRECRFETTQEYTVTCQPTRFGRSEGEPWTVLSGFVDRYGRSATGHPSSLSWSQGLLVLDDSSGLIFRVVADETYAPEATLTSREPENDELTIIANQPPEPPQLLRGTALGTEALSRERKAIEEKRNSMFGRTPVANQNEDEFKG